MTASLVLLKKCLANAGFRPRSYSGRSMYGSECLAVSCDEPEAVLEEVRANNDFISQEEEDAVIRALRHPRSDQLGLRMIAYWPTIAWEDDD